VLGVPAFLGMLLGLGLSYVIEFFDKTFRDNEDVCRRLHAVVLGHIPRLGRGRRAAALRGVADGRLSETTLCTFFRPASVEAEAYRSIRTALYFSNGSEPARVVQVTSPNAGDGKSTLSSNLGVSIAQSGQRTLLIDADMRSPRLHQVFGIAAQAGLSSVISGRLGWREAVVSTPIAGLSLLTAGLRPDNPSELLTSPRFKVLLDELRSEYDFVVIDTPPLLSVTDPAVVAPRVDGVLLTIRINKNGRPRAERARELLDMLGARVLGVVINGVDHHADSGRFYGNTGTYDSRDYDYFLEGESESGSKNGESIAVTPHATSRAEVALDHKHDVVRPIETTSRAD
jgi:capsular exopolysaccharide synthesis family protein